MIGHDFFNPTSINNELQIIFWRSNGHKRIIASSII
jgi:hypothetical protein